MSQKFRRIVTGSIALAVGSALLLGYSTTPALAAGPTVCTSTGGSTTTATIGGIRYNIVTFIAGGTFTPAQATSADYLLVGGGGGGGGGSSTTSGGGGGSGRVNISSTRISIPASAQTITVGTGGAIGTQTTRGGTGGTSSIAALATAVGGGGGGAGATTTTGGNGASTGAGGGASAAAAAGATPTFGNVGGAGFTSATSNLRAGGGGGGPGSAGTAATSAQGGGGGTGTTSSFTNASVTYGGGGGGGAATNVGAGGSSNGGSGGAGTNAGVAGVANRGGGGGGGGNGTANKNGGLGGTGLVIIRYPRYCVNASPPTSVAFSSPTMSWAAPAYLPSGQTVASYTVTYRVSTDTTAGNIYARSTSGSILSLNVTGVAQGACTTNNPSGWTCNAGVTLTSGKTYEFRVFAKSSTGTLGQQAAAITYTVP